MTIRVAINGLGRIGRCVFRAFFEESERFPGLELVAVNSPGDPAACAHLLRYDSVHGRFAVPLRHEGGRYECGGRSVHVFSERNPLSLPWNDLGVDVVLDCTGVFKDKKGVSAHLEAGARKVVISAPADDPDLTIVYGVNHREYRPDMRVVSAASCTTNCLAPLAKILHDRFGIVEGHMTTVHAYTGDQNLVDGSHKDLRRARAAAVSLIPSSTGAAKALKLVLPELAGKIHGTSVRAPVANVSMVDLTCRVEKPADVKSILEAADAAAQGELRGVFRVCREKLVSVDYNHTSESSILDASSVTVISPHFIRAAAWYDNEQAFSLRMLDIAGHIGAC